MKEKTPSTDEVVCFRMLDFETSNFKLEVSKSNPWKITSFSKTTSLPRELFLLMFYTINRSQLLVVKKGFMMIIILSDSQQCPLPLTIIISKVMHTNSNKCSEIQWHCLRGGLIIYNRMNGHTPMFTVRLMHLRMSLFSIATVTTGLVQVDSINECNNNKIWFDQCLA